MLHQRSLHPRLPSGRYPNTDVTHPPPPTHTHTNMGPICGNAVCCSTSKIGFLMQFNMYIYQYLELNWWYAWESISSKNKHDIYFQNPIMQFIIIIRCIHNKNSLFCLGKLVIHKISTCARHLTHQDPWISWQVLWCLYWLKFFLSWYDSEDAMFFSSRQYACVSNIHTHISCTISCLCLIVGTQK